MGSNDAFHAMRRNLTVGQSEALLHKLWLAGGGEHGGEEACQEILRDNLRITLVVDNRITLVDHAGRCIPLPGMITVDADRRFHLTQPEIDYAARLARVQEFFGKDMEFVSPSEFQEHCQSIIERIKFDERISNLAKGLYFPFVIPRLVGDLGEILDDTILPALERSYSAQFPKRSFNNYCCGQLKGQIKVISNTGQASLIEAMTNESVCGVYFPALQGFSKEADCELIRNMPGCLILSGLEVPVVAAMYPEIIGRDYYTPGLDMASLLWKSEDSLFCMFNGDEFCISSSKRNVGDGLFSGGVSIIG